MKLKKEFITHTVDDMQITVNVAPGKDGFHGMLKSNQSAAFIVECLKEDTTEEKIVEKMQAVYDAPKDVLEKDVQRVIETLKSVGAIED